MVGGVDPFYLKFCVKLTALHWAKSPIFSRDLLVAPQSSGGASLNEAPRTITIGPRFFVNILVGTLQNNNRHRSARDHIIFSTRNMRPLSIREAPPPDRVKGVISPALPQR